MSEDTTENEDGGLIDPETGEPFPDTPEGRAAKKEFLTERRDARHPKGGPPGQAKKGTEPTGQE